MTFNQQRTAGESELDAAFGSSLRVSSAFTPLISSQTGVVNARPIGGAASAAVSAWTALTVAGGLVGHGAATLVAQIVQATATTGSVRLRVRGYDQWGNYVEEVTPLVSLVAKTNNFVYLARVFSWVQSVEFQSTGLDIAGDTISIGTRWDWTRTNDGTNEHIAGRNLGIAIPISLARRSGPGFSGGDRRHTASTFAQDATRSVAALNCTVQPLAAATVTIDGVTYTFRASVGVTANEILIGASLAESMANLAAAIQAGPGSGTTYGSATVRHPTVRVRSVSGTQVVIESNALGAQTNLIALAETLASGAWTASNMQFGRDGPVEVYGLSVFDLTGRTAANALTQMTPYDYAIGLSESGWSGSVEKLHILLPASVPQWAVTDQVWVMMHAVSADVRL